MKVIDVCDNFAGAGCLKRYYESINKKDYQVIPLGMFLSVGDIKGDRLSFLKELIDEEYDNSNFIEELISSVNENTIIRVFSSKKDNDSYLVLLYICNLLKGKVKGINVIFTNNYNEHSYSINVMDYKEIDSLLNYEKELTGDEMIKYSNQWEELVETNSELRLLENGKIINKKYSDYDSIILDKLSEIGQCKIADLVGKLMSESLIDTTESVVYYYLVDKLISNNKIKVVNKGERHHVDIIEIC